MNYYRLLAIIIIGWGSGSLFYSLANNKIHPILMSTIATAVYVIVAPLYFFIFKVEYNWNAVGIIYSIIGALLMSIGTTAYCYLLQRGAAGEVTTLAALYPAVTVLLSVLFLGEQFTLKRAFGMCLALLCIYIIH